MWRASFLAIVILTPTFPARGEGIYETGNTIFAACTGGNLPHCVGYLMGVADAMEGNPINGYRACIPVGVIGSQLRDVVVQYLGIHAANRQRGAIGLVADAYEQNFPCR
jgi:hypothetical protein